MRGEYVKKQRLESLSKITGRRWKGDIWGKKWKWEFLSWKKRVNVRLDGEGKMPGFRKRIKRVKKKIREKELKFNRSRWAEVCQSRKK